MPMLTVTTEEVHVDVSAEAEASKELAKLKDREADDAAKNRKYRTDQRFLSETIFSWGGTIFPKVLGKADVWLASLLHLSLFIVDQLYRDGPLNTSDPFVRNGPFFVRINVAFSFMGQTIWMMVFTLTFFVGQCYSRYLAYAGKCAGMGGKLMEISQKLAVDLESQPEARWDVIRYLTASIMLVFGDTQRGKGPAAIHKELFWKRLTTSEAEFLGHEIKTGDGLTVDCKALLTAAEVETLKKFNGSRGMLLQTWALKVAGTAYENIGVTRAFNPIRDDVHAIRQAGAGILNTLNLPVPFAYYHMLVVITAFNYALFAFAYLHMDSFLSPVCMFLTVMMLSGVRELGCELADPFGEDELDFPVMKMMTAARAGVSPIVHDTPWYPSATKSDTAAIKKVVMSRYALSPP